jgi:hypothetical protein
MAEKNKGNPEDRTWKTEQPRSEGMVSARSGDNGSIGYSSNPRERSSFFVSRVETSIPLPGLARWILKQEAQKTLPGNRLTVPAQNDHPLLIVMPELHAQTFGFRGGRFTRSGSWRFLVG